MCRSLLHAEIPVSSGGVLNRTFLIGLSNNILYLAGFYGSFKEFDILNKETYLALLIGKYKNTNKPKISTQIDGILKLEV